MSPVDVSRQIFSSPVGEKRPYAGGEIQVGLKHGKGAF